MKQDKVHFLKLIVGVVTLLSTFSLSTAVTTYDGNAPSAPPTIQATAYSSNTLRVALSWGQALDNVGVTRYNIYRNGTFLVSPQGVGLTYSDTNVVAGATYTYSVQAGDGDGNNGPQSATIEITVADGAVSKVIQAPSAVSTSSSSQNQTQSVSSVYDNVSSSYLTDKIRHPDSITLTAFPTYLQIGWNNKPPYQWRSVRVIKKESLYPLTIHDGKIICDSATGTVCTDRDVIAGKTYYYGVYSVDQSYLTSALVLVSGRLQQSSSTQVDSLTPKQQSLQQNNPQSQSTKILFTKTLRLGSTGQEVLMLQKVLNARGFTIASSGPGSPGQETTLFGRATEKSLRAYQCQKKIVCDGSPEATGYGLVGKTTRGYLNAEGVGL